MLAGESFWRRHSDKKRSLGPIRNRGPSVCFSSVGLPREGSPHSRRDTAPEVSTRTLPPRDSCCSHPLDHLLSLGTFTTVGPNPPDRLGRPGPCPAAASGAEHCSFVVWHKVVPRDLGQGHPRHVGSVSRSSRTHRALAGYNSGHSTRRRGQGSLTTSACCSARNLPAQHDRREDPHEDTAGQRRGSSCNLLHRNALTSPHQQSTKQAPRGPVLPRINIDERRLARHELVWRRSARDDRGWLQRSRGYAGRRFSGVQNTGGVGGATNSDFYQREVDFHPNGWEAVDLAGSL